MARGIVVIHGIGEQKKGDFLKEIVNPLVSYDALTEGRPIDLYLREHPKKRRLAGSERYRRIVWVTVGAALNRSYTMTGQEAASHARSASGALPERRGYYHPCSFDGLLLAQSLCPL